MRFSRLDELPPEAATDRKSFRPWGPVVSVSLPLSVRGAMLGVLVLRLAQGRAQLVDELVQRFSSSARSSPGRSSESAWSCCSPSGCASRRSCRSRSATFSSLSATEVDREIKRALRRIADFFRADWGSLAEFSHDTRVARVTHSWVTEGATPRPSTVSLADIPWVHGPAARGEMVRFSRIEELPAEAAAVDRETYRKPRDQVAGGGPAEGGGSAARGAHVQHARGRARLAGRADAAAPAPRRGLRQCPVAQAVGARGAAAPAGPRATSARVSTMGELTASLAHELNQPLTAILSNAQAAQRLLAADPVDLERDARDPERHRRGRQAGRRGDPPAARPAQEGRPRVRGRSTSTRSSARWRGS